MINVLDYIKINKYTKIKRKMSYPKKQMFAVLIIKKFLKISKKNRFDARYWMLGAGALGRPRGMVRGGRREEGSRWGTSVYLWQIHVDVWQNQYNIVKLKNKN